MKQIVTLIPEHEQESIPYEANSIEIGVRRKSNNHANVSIDVDQEDFMSPEEAAIITKSSYNLNVVSKKDLEQNT